MMLMDVRSANQSPQSVSSSGMDSGVDSLSDPMGDLPHVAISLCGGLTDNREITRGLSCDLNHVHRRLTASLTCSFSFCV